MVSRCVAVFALLFAAAAAEVHPSGGASWAEEAPRCLAPTTRFSGACKPSFLIVGFGKCGSSSLYYYLASHPNVRAAATKQVQFFDHGYAEGRFESHYLRAFATDLRPGEMTGESSPGYVAYPRVVPRVKRHLGGTGGAGGTSFLVSWMDAAIVREPAARAYSAYAYHYAHAARKRALPFGTLIESEMTFLRKCFARDAVKQGCDPGRPELCKHALSECYAAATPNEQVGEAARRAFGPRHASEAMPLQNAHLWRQLVGRSLYSAYLEWWYEAFASTEVLLVCLEDLTTQAAAAAEMARVAKFLALPVFDFGGVLAGRFNAGDAHTGYDAVTPWDAAPGGPTREPPDPAAMAVLARFAKPFTERLFELADHRCSWGRNDGFDELR